MQLTKAPLFFWGLSALLTGCISGDDDGSTPGAPAPVPRAAFLVQLGGCDEAEDRIREAALERMEKQLDENLQAILDDEYWGCWAEGDDQAGGIPSPQPPTAPGAGSNKASDSSGTNNQVVGVEEADFVKNDGDYIYIVSNGSLRIIDGWPAESSHEVSNTLLEGEPKKLFLKENTLVVYSSLSPPQASEDPDAWGYRWQPRECTYGYQCSFTGDGHPTRISVFNVRDRENPVLLREVSMSGSLLAARRIDGDVHSVFSDGEPVIDGVTYWPEGFSFCGEEHDEKEIRAAFAELLRRNRALIESAPSDNWLPTVHDVVYQDGVAAVQNSGAACGNMYGTSVESGGGITTLASVELDRTDTMGITAVVSRPGVIYASKDAVYMATSYQQNQDWWFRGWDQQEATTVHKFSLGQHSIQSNYAGSGIVKGHVLNQFSMDQYQGKLRVATTSGWVPSPDVHSSVTILGEANGSLQRLGLIDNMAPKEDIRSVRFAGDHGFVVTFKKTDPLFVLGLADAENPKVLAELKIPGFSTYMHLMDEGHLLTIGYDADDQGDFAWFTGVMLQIFDVSDLENPTLKHKEIIGTRGSSSEALTNHLAFNYYATRNVLALPMTVCEGGSGGGGYGTEMTFSGLMVYDVTAADGFSNHGNVPHPPSEQASCSNWWTNASSEVKRSVFFEDYVFSISDSLMKVNRMTDLSQDLAALPLVNE